MLVRWERRAPPPPCFAKPTVHRDHHPDTLPGRNRNAHRLRCEPLEIPQLLSPLVRMDPHRHSCATATQMAGSVAVSLACTPRPETTPCGTDMHVFVWTYWPRSSRASTGKPAGRMPCHRPSCLLEWRISRCEFNIFQGLNDKVLDSCK